MLLVPVATWILTVLAVLAGIPHWVSGWPSFGLPNLQSNFPKLFANQLTPPNGEVWHGLWNQFDPLPCITCRTHETITLRTHVHILDFYGLQAGNILRSQHEKHVWVDTKVVSDAAFLHDRQGKNDCTQRQQKKWMTRWQILSATENREAWGFFTLKTKNKCAEVLIVGLKANHKSNWQIFHNGLS